LSAALGFCITASFFVEFQELDMLTIAGGILLALVGLFALLFIVSIVAESFTRRKRYDPTRFPLGTVRQSDLRCDPPSHR
jgi:hypothetical protein